MQDTLLPEAEQHETNVESVYAAGDVQDHGVSSSNYCRGSTLELIWRC